jgi:hypothetical protein
MPAHIAADAADITAIIATHDETFFAAKQAAN